jgi:hypothetical protein
MSALNTKHGLCNSALSKIATYRLHRSEAAGQSGDAVDSISHYLRLGITAVLCVLSINSFAVTPDQAQEIFREVAEVAKLDSPPSLTISAETEKHRFVAESTLKRGCSVTVSSTFLAANGEDSVAGVLGHELAHCALHHKSGARLVQLESDTWPNEYAADELGVTFAEKAGFKGRAGLQAVVARSLASLTHPSGLARVAALNGESRLFKTPINMSNMRMATTMAVVNGSLVLRAP